MARQTGADRVSRCTNCGFETGDGSSWDVVETPEFGELTQCPECGSTKVTVLS